MTITIPGHNNKEIIIADRHKIYFHEISTNFEHYFSAVRPKDIAGKQVVDYSCTAEHWVIGYDLHPVIFPSVAEPFSTTQEYLDFAELSPGQTVLDLGAYSGLSAMAFKQAVGAAGQVVAVEADIENYSIAQKNLQVYNTKTSNIIDLVHAAIWTHNDGVDFGSESAMGSFVAELNSKVNRGVKNLVPSLTLSKLCEEYNLDSIDFIKCDIEGAERYIFSDREFFKRFNPKIIVEMHSKKHQLPYTDCFTTLRLHGYDITESTQVGSDWPILKCERIQ